MMTSYEHFCKWLVRSSKFRIWLNGKEGEAGFEIGWVWIAIIAAAIAWVNR